MGKAVIGIAIGLLVFTMAVLTIVVVSNMKKSKPNDKPVAVPLTRESRISSMICDRSKNVSDFIISEVYRCMAKAEESDLKNLVPCTTKHLMGTNVTMRDCYCASNWGKSCPSLNDYNNCMREGKKSPCEFIGKDSTKRCSKINDKKTECIEKVLKIENSSSSVKNVLKVKVGKTSKKAKKIIKKLT